MRSRLIALMVGSAEAKAAAGGTPGTRGGLRSNTRRGMGLILALGLMATVVAGGSVSAKSDPLVGTWHERDHGTSNIFYFIGEPVGGVYHVLYFDDFTSGPVCGDGGPMLWVGFGYKTGTHTLEGSFGDYWCPDNGDGDILQRPWDVVGSPAPFTITYYPATDTITGSGECVGTRQPYKTVAKAMDALAKGKFPPQLPYHDPFEPDRVCTAWVDPGPPAD